MHHGTSHIAFCVVCLGSINLCSCCSMHAIFAMHFWLNKNIIMFIDQCTWHDASSYFEMHLMLRAGLICFGNKKWMHRWFEVWTNILWTTKFQTRWFVIGLQEHILCFQTHSTGMLICLRKANMKKSIQIRLQIIIQLLRKFERGKLQTWCSLWPMHLLFTGRFLR